MKPPVVHQPVQPPAPSDAGNATEGRSPTAKPDTGSQGLVGNFGPIVDGRTPADRDGAGADERKAP